METAEKSDGRGKVPGGRLLWAASGVFADPAVRYGIKFGLAGVVAVYISLVLRLDNPGWALLTVFVLMVAQYVGAIAEKSVFRMVGTLIGGVIGYLLTGSLEQNSLVFLGLLGAIVGGATALFGQSRYPYAFLLCGMTTLVVASNGMARPDTSWTFMLSRIEEVFVGLVVTMAVQGLVWPRYARAEFVVLLRRAFGDLRGCLLGAAGVGGSGAGHVLAADFPRRIAGLRSLMEFGARESRNFRRRLETYSELMGCLGRIASAIGTLRQPIPPGSLYRQHAGTELDAVLGSLAEALGCLESAACSAPARRASEEAVARAFSDLEEKFRQLRDEGLAEQIPTDTALTMGLHLCGLDDVRQQIGQANALLDSMPEDPLQREFGPQPMISPWPPPFWIKAGVKSGAAVVAAFAIANWLKPPGAPMFILGTWMFTALNAASPGGQGDRRAFHIIPLNVLLLTATSLVILAARPLLSSYAVMNTVIFCSLFLWGFNSYTTRGMTIPMQLGMLVVVGILGLNGQEPVPFQAVVNFFFGLCLALVLSALFQRLLWPSLPQWEVRDRLLDALDICGQMLARHPLPLWLKTRLTLIPSEVDLRIEHLVPPICPQGEAEKLASLALALSSLGCTLAITINKMPPGIPPERIALGTPLVKRMEEAFGMHLAEIRASLRTNRARCPDESALLAVLAEWRDWAAATRRDLLHRSFHPLDLARVTGHAERYQLIGAEILSLGRLAGTLRTDLYMGDCWL